MIDVIGKKRLFVIALLLGVAGLLATANYAFLMPQNKKAEMTLRQTKTKVSQTRSEIDRLVDEYNQIQEKREYITKLENIGFFNDQNRTIVQNKIQSIHELTDVLSARYTIKPAEIINDSDALKADHVILDSSLSLKIDASNDEDVNNFMYWLEHGLPGTLIVKYINVQKKGEIDEDVLKLVGNGKPVVLVSANVEYSWRTMVPRASIMDEEGNL